MWLARHWALSRNRRVLGSIGGLWGHLVKMKCELWPSGGRRDLPERIAWRTRTPSWEDGIMNYEV